MTDQEVHDARRAELLSGIQAALSGPGAPVAPAPLAADATPAQRETHEASVRDYAVLTTLTKTTGDVSAAERDQLRVQVMDCLKRGW